MLASPYSSAPAVNVVPSSSLALDGAARSAALQRTEVVLRDLVALCRRMDLPASALPQVLEVYASAAHEVALEARRAAAEAAAAAQTSRQPMRVSSLDREWKPLRIKPGEVVPVVARPMFVAYRVEEIEIEGDPTRWRVHDVKVGNLSQVLGVPGPIPGERFRKGGIMSELRMTTCQTAMELLFLVEYVGPCAEGEVFDATLVGTAVDYPVG